MDGQTDRQTDRQQLFYRTLHRTGVQKSQIILANQKSYGNPLNILVCQIKLLFQTST